MYLFLSHVAGQGGPLVCWGLSSMVRKTLRQAGSCFAFAMQYLWSLRASLWGSQREEHRGAWGRFYVNLHRCVYIWVPKHAYPLLSHSVYCSWARRPYLTAWNRGKLSGLARQILNFSIAMGEGGGSSLAESCQPLSRTCIISDLEKQRGEQMALPRQEEQ